MQYQTHMREATIPLLSDVVFTTLFMLGRQQAIKTEFVLIILYSRIITNDQQPLTCSTDMTHSSSAQGAVINYFRSTAHVAEMLAVIFKTLFPDYYARHEAAFKASG